jgi:hypothetical protein
MQRTKMLMLAYVLQHPSHSEAHFQLTPTDREDDDATLTSVVGPDRKQEAYGCSRGLPLSTHIIPAGQLHARTVGSTRL